MTTKTFWGSMNELSEKVRIQDEKRIYSGQLQHCILPRIIVITLWRSWDTVLWRNGLRSRTPTMCSFCIVDLHRLLNSFVPFHILLVKFIVSLLSENNCQLSIRVTTTFVGRVESGKGYWFCNHYSTSITKKVFTLQIPTRFASIVVVLKWTGWLARDCNSIGNMNQIMLKAFLNYETLPLFEKNRYLEYWCDPYTCSLSRMSERRRRRDCSERHNYFWNLRKTIKYVISCFSSCKNDLN